MSAPDCKPILSRIASFPVFIFLIGLYPVLYLLAENLGQTAPEAAARSVFMAVIVSLVISGVCLLLIRPAHRAYLAAALLNLAFFSYGHLFNLVDARTINGVLVGRHSLFFPLFSVVVLGLLLVILRRPSPRESPAPLLNTLLVGLCLFQFVAIGSYELSASHRIKTSETQVAGQTSAGVSGESSPDIYYIVLDGLVREDVLREELGYSDYNLPEELNKRGFVIPDCAFSNYGGTSLSITSALNFDYIDALGVPDEQVNTGKDDPAELYSLLHQNRVVGYLKQRGYDFVSFRGFFPINDFKEADYYFNIAEDQQGRDALAERSFQEMFIRTTLLRLPSELIIGSPQVSSRIPRAVAELIAPEAGVFSSRSYQWYQQHLYSFDTLETVPALPGNKFTYAHFYSTHQPYVFKPDGSLLWPINEDNAGYVASVQFTSRRILAVIDRILRDSPEPPVIILQADHGYGTGLNKYKILNAYYLPNGGESDLYPTITPVNTFRVVLNHYAGGNFDLLPDTIMKSEPGNRKFFTLPVDCDLK